MEINESRSIIIRIQKNIRLTRNMFDKIYLLVYEYTEIIH